MIARGKLPLAIKTSSPAPGVPDGAIEAVASLILDEAEQQARDRAGSTQQEVEAEMRPCA